MKEIKKAVVDLNLEIEGLEGLLGELLPLGEKPILEIILKDLLKEGIKEIAFLPPQKEKDMKAFLKALSVRPEYEEISFSFPRSLKEEMKKGDDLVFLSSSDLLLSESGSLEQLMKVFRTSERPVLGLKKEEGGEVKTEKIARRLYKIESVSGEGEFIFLGRAVFTSLSSKFFSKGTIIEGLEEMDRKGHTVYGIELEGKYFKITDKESYLKASSYYFFKKSPLSSKINKFLEEEKLL